MKTLNKFVTGNGKRFKTRKKALAYAASHYARTGVIISVEELIP